MQDDNTVKARKALETLWQASDLRGRCWGLKRKDNPFAGTNINIAFGDELISVSMNSDNELVIHQFIRTAETKLGIEAKKILQNKNLPISR